MTSRSRSRRLSSSLAIGLTGVALVAPTAPAKPFPSPQDSAPVDAPTVRSTDPGFDWGSAGLGAEHEQPTGEPTLARG